MSTYRAVPCLSFIFVFHRSQFNEGWLSWFRRGGGKNFKLKDSQNLTDFLMMWYVCSVRWRCLGNDWNSISKWANKCSPSCPTNLSDGEPSAERDTNLQCLYFKQELILTPTLELLKHCDVAVVCLWFNRMRSSLLCLHCVLTHKGFP